MRLSVILPAALLALGHLGCSGTSGTNPTDPSQQNQYGAQGQYPPGQYGAPQGQGQYGGQATPGQYTPQGQAPGQYPQQGAYPQQQPAQPGMPAQPAQPGQPAAGGQATPIPAAAAMAATPVLQAMAVSEVQGMQPDGGAFAGQFQEGQTLEQAFNIQAGKCYSVIGVGLGIQALHVKIVAQPAPMLPPIPLAQDNGAAGPNVTLGGKGQCWKNPTPIGGPAKVILTATRGAGIGVAQIFSK